MYAKSPINPFRSVNDYSLEAKYKSQCRTSIMVQIICDNTKQTSKRKQLITVISNESLLSKSDKHSIITICYAILLINPSNINHQSVMTFKLSIPHKTTHKRNNLQSTNKHWSRQTSEAKNNESNVITYINENSCTSSYTTFVFSSGITEKFRSSEPYLNSLKNAYNCYLEALAW